MQNETPRSVAIAAAVSELEAIIRRLESVYDDDIDWDTGGPAREAIRLAMDRAGINGLSGCPLCCS